MVTRVGKFKLSAQTKPYIADSHQDLPTMSTRVEYWILIIGYWILDIEIKLDYPQQQISYCAHPQHLLFVCPNRLSHS